MDQKRENSTSTSEITSFLSEKLPQTDRKDIEDGLNWHLVLENRKQRKKKQTTRKKLLTRKQKNKLGLTKLPKNNWDYKKLIKMNEMWKNYVLAALNHPKSLPKPEDPDYANFGTILNKLELIGAEILVVRSNLPSYVGISGIIVAETKFTVQLVTRESKLKILLKEKCLFQVNLNNWTFTMFGKHFVTRSSERSVKKTKFFSISDL